MTNSTASKGARLALGTVQFGIDYGIANKQGQVSRNEAKTILEHAWANGMDTLDTAIAYGDSEQRLGEIGIQGWQVVTKLPAVPEDCGDVSQWMVNSVQESLRRLKQKSLYGLLLHRPQQLLENDGDRIYYALQQLKHDGLVKKIGVSIYDPAELDALCSRYQLDIVQAPFNLMDRRLINTGWLTRLKEQDTELHVRSVFLQGLLLMNSSDRPKKFDRWGPLWAKYDAWLKQVGLTPSQACLRYALSFSEIGKVVIGVDSLNQLKEIIQASTGQTPIIPEELQTHDIDLLNPARWNQI
ncbi:MAG: aldo/keto reductase [Gallionella sp.]|nr:aldo/keto reductase [Gallionella sp.]